MNFKTIKFHLPVLVAASLCLTATNPASSATMLTGLLGIDSKILEERPILDDAGNPVLDADGNPTYRPIYLGGSYFSMSGFNPFTATSLVPNNAGILLGSYQNFILDPDEPHPEGHPDAPFGAGSGYGSIPIQEGVLAPFSFFGNPTYVGTNPIGYQSGELHVAPQAWVDFNDCESNWCTMTADLSSWEVVWNGTAFEQGPRPVSSEPFVLAAGVYNEITQEYHLDWTSQIKGGSFNGVIGTWVLEGTHSVVPLPGALWFALSGLLALVGVGRKGKAF